MSIAPYARSYLSCGVLKRTLPLLLACGIGSASTHAADVDVEDACKINDEHFAHCPGTSLNYYAVIVAVHGWKGDCATTFGEGPESIFNVLKSKQFFDFDCFAYDSQHVSLNDNIKMLKHQLYQLNDLGYSQVMLITHSTGGVIACAY